MTTSINQFGINFNAINILKSFLLVCIFCLMSADSFAQFKRTIPNANHRIPSKYTKKYKFNKKIPVIKPNCPDLAVMPIQFRIVRKTSEFNAIVRVTAVVKNIGGQDYISGRNQQRIHLYVGRDLKRNIGFERLAVGATRTVVYDINFSLSNEFPPMIEALISQDPDIGMDGNKKNDECKTSNNSQERSSHEMRELF